MKVVGIISSSNRRGSSATLLREALEGARAAGAETEEVFLPDLDIGFCRGCMSCSRTGSCVLTDDFAPLRQTLLDADGIILSSPTYGAAPCARMKNVFDRLGMFEYLTSAVFGGKYVAAISTCASFGAKDTTDYMTHLPLGTVFQRAYVSGKLSAKISGGKRASECAEYMKRARDLGSRLAEDVRSRRGYPLQSLVARVVNSLLMRPLIAKGIADHKDGEMCGVYSNLANRGLIA